MRQVVTDVAVMLASAGFRRKDNHLIRQVSSLWHCFHFQASQWGSGDAGTFTVNLIVTSDYFHRAWTGRPPPKNPASEAPMMSQRIGSLRPDRRDHWWPVDASTDARELGSDVAQNLARYGLPFFEPYASDESVLRMTGNGGIASLSPIKLLVVQAVVAVHLGREQEAQSRIDTALSEAADHPFADTTRLVANRLGLKAG